MPLTSEALLQPAQHLDVVIEPRWVMAYAAGIPDERAELYDTRQRRLTVHPLFTVAPEWQLIAAMHADGTGLDRDERRRGIHIGHDLLLASPPPTAGAVHLTARTVAVGRRRAGATHTVEFTASIDTITVWRTRMTSLYLGVGLRGEPTAIDTDWPASGSAVPGDSGPQLTEPTLVRSIDAHVYSECARIWNPIHTDMAVAQAAGLAAPILHGTATLARAVSISSRLVNVPLDAITRVEAEFSGQVELGTSLTIRVRRSDAGTVWFDAVRPDGAVVLRHASFRYRCEASAGQARP